MKFVADGPDIPDSVRQALDEDRLVIFCGAGISMSVRDGVPGLPSFSGLVLNVRDRLRATFNHDEDVAYKEKQYDRVLHLLEARFDRNEVRKIVTEELTVKIDFEIHKSLIDLAKLKDGGVRMVTTNFDHLFDEAIASLGVQVPADVSPLLPVPKAHRWQSLVYIHGKIPVGAPPSHPAVQSLVYTSGDFGRAYLTERWGSRFVTELFRTYSVLFIGYSMGDPVMRYLLDALAADKQASDGTGGLPTVAWALASYKDDAERAKIEEQWKAKGVEPLLYKTRPHRDHAPHHETLAKWAEQKRYGLKGRIKVAEAAALKTPVPPYEGDPELDAVRWALTDDTAARHFANAEQAPPVEWLPLLEQWGLLGLKPGRMTRLGNAASTDPMPGADWAVPSNHHILLWITRHLDKPAALDWAVRGGMPHPVFQHLVRDRLAKSAADEGTPAGPDQCPFLQPELAAAWRVIADAEIRTPEAYILDAEACRLRLRSGETGILVERHLVRMLSPIARLKRDNLRGTFWSGHPTSARPSVRDHIAIEVRPACEEFTDIILRDVAEHRDRQSLLANIADDVTTNLKRAMDLFALVGDANADFDPSQDFDIRSSSEQLRQDDWLRLIEVTRDAMDCLREVRPEAADILLERWKTFPYPVFRRLVLDAYRSLI